MSQSDRGHYFTVPGSAWRLALGTTPGNGRHAATDASPLLAYGTYQGGVGVLDPATGETRWHRDLGAFPFALNCARFGPDDGERVLAACADGHLWALDAQGATRWTHLASGALYGVAVARLGQGQQAVVTGGMDRQITALSTEGRVLATREVEWLVHRLIVADIDGDGVDEVLVLDGRNTLEAFKLAGSRLLSCWKRTLTVPERMRNWENPRGLFHAFSLDSVDLDGDGRDDLVLGDTYFNRQNVLALSPDGETHWITEPLPRRLRPERWYEFYSACFVRAGADVAGIHGAPPGANGPFVVALAGGLVRVFTSDGRLIGQAESRLGFADLVLDGHTLYLGSTPSGDDTLYRIDLATDWVGQIESLERQGRARAVGEHLASLRQQALEASVSALASPSPVYPIKLSPGWDRPLAPGAEANATIALFQQVLPYPSFQFLVTERGMESTPPLNADGEPWNAQRWETDVFHGTQTVDEIIEGVRRAETLGVPVVYNIGHSNMPFVTLQTANRMLDAGPHAVKGFMSAEDEDPTRVNRYLAEYVTPLVDRCLAHAADGQPAAVLLKNKGVWWMSMPATQPAFRELLQGERRRVVVAATEDSNSRTPEINLFARVGLRQAGLINRFQVSIHQDLFSFNRWHQWEYPKSGHPYLRLLVAHTVLGGDWFEIRVYATDLEEYGDERKVAFTTLGREAVETFFHLLGKGLVLPPRPEQMIGLSRVGLAVHPLPEQWLRDGHNGHRPWLWEATPELEAAVLPHIGNNWGLTPTPEHALQRVLLNKRRQFGANVPATPYGPFAIVPAWADLEQVQGVSEWWHTDGLAVWRSEAPAQRLTGMAAAEAVQSSFERAAAYLPYRATGDDAFIHSVRLPTDAAAGGYVDRIYLLDPGWLDPQDRHVTVHVQRASVRELHDRLSGERLPVLEGKVHLTVPAGSLRILEALP